MIVGVVYRKLAKIRRETQTRRMWGSGCPQKLRQQGHFTEISPRMGVDQWVTNMLLHTVILVLCPHREETFDGMSFREKLFSVIFRFLDTL